jgi:hypothetical protein
LMATFGWSPDYVVNDLPGAEGNVWYAWARENQAGFWGETPERTGDGYVRQEIRAVAARRGRKL